MLQVYHTQIFLCVCTLKPISPTVTCVDWKTGGFGLFAIDCAPPWLNATNTHHFDLYFHCNRKLSHDKADANLAKQTCAYKCIVTS